MTEHEMRRAIAEACKFQRINHNDGCWYNPNLDCHYNDILHDLNAMHEAEKVLNFDKKERYGYLIHLAKLTNFNPTFATAKQRAEAFCRTLFPERFK